MSKRKKAKLSLSKKIFIAIVTILVIIVGVGIGAMSYGYSLLNKMEKVEVKKEDLGVSSQVEEKLQEYNDTIENIALFGIDTTDGGTGRSDSIMIATIDRKHNKLKLTSIMRDSYVEIPGRSGKDKINHAHAFGGPELAIRTLNENFDLNITDFASVNFTTLPKIIDKIGGIEIDIDDEELKYINNYINDINRKNGTKEATISSTGVQHINGTQAMAYCRIRYTTGGDYKRTERHREVLEKIFEKVTKVSPTKWPSLLNEILPMVQTSMDASEIIDLGNTVLKMGTGMNLEQERFPVDGYCEGKMINGVYYLTFDKATTVEQMHQYIFEDKKTY